MKNRIISILCIFLLIAPLVNAQDRPNIVLILADDLGFSDIGSYGGEVETPNLDLLAAKGLRYKQFYNAARCCPTRASLLTGVYPHQAGMGWMAAADLGTPAYQGNLNDNCVTIAEVVKSAGYSTYMSGKWHLTNERKIDGMVTDNWPLQRGFDRYFGIIPGGANYFTPVVYSGNSRYKAPEDFYLTTAISDSSVRYIDQHFTEGNKNPFFLYVAYTAPHWPLHALQKEIDKYKERYLAGWDKLREERFERQKALGLFSEHVKMSPRDTQIEAWDSLTAEQQEEMAMRMAIYAAQIDIMDQGIGQIVGKLKEKGVLDNTLILFLSDNGACAEYISSGKSKEVNGKEDTFESYRINWANLSSTPYKEYKHYTYEGGIASPLIVHWPQGVPKSLNNTFVSDYGHITDVMATCVEVSGADYPETYKGHQIVSMQGKSLMPHFSSQQNDRGIIYWEHEANIAMRDGKWKLVSRTPEDSLFREDELALYNMDDDPVEMNNLAPVYPERVNSMYQSWAAWAKKIGAFPLDTRNYGLRAQSYRKKVNGSFEEDKLGGWAIRESDQLKGSVRLDSSSVLTGQYALHVSPVKSQAQTDDLRVFWRFQAKRGERYQVKLTSKARDHAKYTLRFERPNGKNRLLDQTIESSNEASPVSTSIIEVQEDGAYAISLYFNELGLGEDLWIDDVELIEKTSIAQSSKPNIVIIMADDLDSRQLSAYGGQNINTKHIDALAAEGLQFNQMIASEAMCIPTRASLFTGLYPARSGAYQNHKSVNPGLKSVPHYLGDLGYRVALTGKDHMTKPKDIFPFEIISGFEPNCVAATDEYNLDSIKTFIEDADDPFCLFVMSINPHAPWTVGDPSEFNADSLILPPHWADTRLTRNQFTKYLAEVRRLDDQVGDIVQLLKETGQEQNTIVIFLG